MMVAYVLAPNRCHESATTMCTQFQQLSWYKTVNGQIYNYMKLPVVEMSIFFLLPSLHLLDQLTKNLEGNVSKIHLLDS